MREDFLLLNPGPVPIAHEVAQAMDAPMISRRSTTFGEIYNRTIEKFEALLRRSTGTSDTSPATGDTLILNGTATMALEAGISNLVGPEDEIVALTNGQFGRRMADIGERYATVTVVETPWGEPFDLQAVRSAVTDDTALLTVVHNETSTGLLNPIAPIGEIAAAHDVQLLVDGVSSIGGAPFLIDEWGVDVAVTEPQKALASPPGISLLFASPAAQTAMVGTRGPFYHDLETYLEAAADDRTPYTCAAPQVRALDVALDRILTEGMESRIDRHARYALAVRAGLTAMGLELFPSPREEADYSPTLTTAAFPDAFDPVAFQTELARRGVSVGGGIAHLSSEVFRFGNMGELSPDEIVRGMYAVGQALRAGGADVPVSAAVAETEAVIR